MEHDREWRTENVITRTQVLFDGLVKQCRRRCLDVNSIFSNSPRADWPLELQEPYPCTKLTVAGEIPGELNRRVTVHDRIAPF